MTTSSRRSLRARIDRTVTALGDHGGWGAPALDRVAGERRDPWAVLAGTILSLRTKDDVTYAAAERLLTLAATPAKLLELSARRLEKLIFPVGFYRTKARSLRSTARLLIERHAGRVPCDLDALLALPGVGRKTANLVLVLGFGIPAICVDTHVHRISNRLGFCATTTPEETETALRDLLPRKHWLTINSLLVSFGQRICQPVSPRCTQCPIRRRCPRVGVSTSR